MKGNSWQVLSTALLFGAAAVGEIAHAQVPPAERAALIDFYTSTHGAGWKSQGGWLGAQGTECNWLGVSCVGGYIASINLFDNGLTGTFPATLTALTELTELNVTHNAITGPLPALGSLPKLQRFVATSNALTGPIPSLQGATALQDVLLGDNQLRNL